MNLSQYGDDIPSTLSDLRLSTAMGFLHILTILVTALGNFIVISVIVRSHKLHTITSGFLLNLAISDLAAGLVLLPFAASSGINHGWIYSPAFCTLLGFLYILLCFASTWTLACISLERFIAVNSPLKYHQMINKRRVAIITTLIWTGAAINATFPFAEGELDAYVFLPHYTFCLLNYRHHMVTAIIIPITAIFIPFGIMCYTYVSIGRIACSHAKRKIVECNKDHCMFVAPKTKDYRAAKILAVMAGVFLVCWIPFTILNLWQASVEVTFPFFLTATSLWLTFLSSAINPWLYSMLNRAFRQATRAQAVKLLRKLRIMRTNDGMDILENTSKALSNANRVSMKDLRSCKDTPILQPKEGSNNNVEDRNDKDIADTNCAGSFHDSVADNVPGALIQLEHIPSSLHNCNL